MIREYTYFTDHVIPAYCPSILLKLPYYIRAYRPIIGVLGYGDLDKSGRITLNGPRCASYPDILSAPEPCLPRSMGAGLGHAKRRRGRGPRFCGARANR